MGSLINSELLASMVKAKRGSKGLRALADELDGVSASTLSRIEGGKIPDVETFVKICKWLEVSTDTFTGTSSETKADQKPIQLLAHLRADKELDSNTVNTIINMIDFAYHHKSSKSPSKKKN